MKIVVALFLAAMVFAPSTAFGWKSIASLYEEDCIVNCIDGPASIDSSKPMNFILLAMGSLVVLGLYIRSSRLGKYETFSMKCKHCGKNTRGLKCVMCEARKQKAV